MQLEEFKQSVLRTWNTEGDTETRLFNATLGIIGELGEVAEPIKKTLFHGKEYDTDKYLKEVGDVLYYLVAYFEEVSHQINEDAINHHFNYIVYQLDENVKFGIFSEYANMVVKTLREAYRISKFGGTYEEFISEAMRLNKAKLEERYPDGFSKAISSVKEDEKQ